MLAFSAKVPCIVQEAVALMTIFTEEFAAFSFHFAAADGAAVFQSVCTHFQYQDSFCPGFVLKLGSDLAAEMKRGKVSAFYHCHSGEVLVVVGQDDDPCLVLFAEVQDLAADLMGVVLGQILKAHVVFPVWLGAIVIYGALAGFLYFIFQLSAGMTVLVSPSAGVDGKLFSLFVQDAAHGKGVCVGKADAADPGACSHSFFGGAGICVLLLHRDIQHIAPALPYKSWGHELTIFRKGTSFQMTVGPDPFLAVPKLQADGVIRQVGIHSFEKGYFRFQVLGEFSRKLSGALYGGGCFIDGSAA